MKVLILGATGGTGKEIVSQALERDHEVTVLVRDAKKLSQANRVRVVQGDVLDKQALATAMQGQEAVISALGVGGSLKSHGLIASAVAAIIPAMNQAGVKRIVFLSAYGVGDTILSASLLQKLFFRFVLDDLYADKAKGDKLLRASNLDWTIVYPPKLTNGPLTRRYRVVVNPAIGIFPTISRADVAEFMLFQLKDKVFIRQETILLLRDQPSIV